MRRDQRIIMITYTCERCGRKFRGLVRVLAHAAICIIKGKEIKI